jgi:hypothetical protein
MKDILGEISVNETVPADRETGLDPFAYQGLALWYPACTQLLLAVAC